MEVGLLSLDLKATVKVLDRVSGTFYRRARGTLEEMPPAPRRCWR